jgi:two-component system, chemotaxis family, chemotaxis protein CheY
MDLAHYKFLVVDDHSLIRRIVISELKKLGASGADEAADGAEAIQKIRSANLAGAPYHTVFLDWTMPNVNGPEVLSACRADRTLDNMAIVMLSSESEEENVLKALEAGATAYITKPFKAEMLDQKLEDVLKWKSSRNKAVAHG